MKKTIPTFIRSGSLTILLALLCNAAVMAQQYTVDTFNMSNTSALTTNDLTTISVSNDNVVWIGSANQGLYRFKYYDDGSFVKAPVLTNNRIAQIINSGNNTFIAQYGASGAQATNGGVDVILNSSNSFDYLHFAAFYTGGGTILTRYVRGIFYDSTTNRIIASNTDDITAGNTRTGGYSIINASWDFSTNPSTVMTGDSIYSTSNMSTQMFAVSKVNFPSHSEYWLSAGNNCAPPCFAPRILRIGMDGNYTGNYFDAITTMGGLPIGGTDASTVVRAILQDNSNNVWCGLSNGTIAVYNTVSGLWISPDLSALIPSMVTAQVNFNAIAVSNNRVLIGTTAGLLIYDGVGSVGDASSYKLLTTTDGLSANNITGVSASQDGKDLWLSSFSGGVMKVSGQTSLTVERLKVNNTTTTVSDTLNIFGLKIAADSSKNIIFTASGVGMNSKIFQIKQDSTSAETAKYGALELLSRSNTVVRYRYRSPVYFDAAIGNEKIFTLNLQLKDTLTGTLIEERPIQIIRPPVMMLHGLWSDGGAWFTFYQKLIASNYYDPIQLEYINYPGGASFENNLSEIERLITNFENLLLYNNISFGKIDLVGHSMGGILSRLYVQRDEYQNNVNKLITVNTPHSGSPWATLMNHIANVSAPLIDVTMVAKFGITGLAITNLVRQKWTNFNPGNDAIRDLAIESNAMQRLNDYSIIKTQNHPIHAVYTTIEEPALAIEDIIANSTGVLSALIRLSAIKRTGNLKPLEDFLFDEHPHDLIVSDVSQKGGLASSFLSFVDHQMHVGSSENSNVMDTLQSLLISSPVDDRFSYDGFAPATIVSPFLDTANEGIYIEDLSHIAAMITMDDIIPSTLEIMNVNDGDEMVSGSTFSVNVVGSSDIQDIGLIAGGKTTAVNFMMQNTGNTASFTVDIPIESDGEYPLIAVGFNDSGLVVIDTISLVVHPTATLYNIKIPNAVYTRVNGEGEFMLYGNFSDGITRNISYNSGFTVTSDFAKSQYTTDNLIKGISEGEDSITVTYMGFTTKAKVYILPEENDPLPIKLLNFNVECDNNTVTAKWSLNVKQGNTYCILQRSSNGKDFKDLYQVKISSINEEVRNMSIEDKNASDGLAYYRLAISDDFSKNSFSTVVALNPCNKQYRTILIPNPAKDEIKLETQGIKGSYDVIIVDVAGKNVIKESTISGREHKIKLDKLASGVYFLTLKSDGYSETIKFIKL